LAWKERGWEEGNGIRAEIKVPSNERNTFKAGKRKTLNGQWTKVSAIFNGFLQDKEGKKYDKGAKILPVTTLLWRSMYRNKCAHS
jgi:hypothetical protein